MKLRHGFIIILTAAVFLCGCSLSPDGSGLLHPPKTTGNEAEIERLIESTAEGSYMLKYPNSGDYRSAIITYDIDKDGAKEAVAFYRTQGSNPVTNMLIMRDTEEGYKICYRYETQYSDIDCVQFADYDFDGIDEILAGFVTYTTGINELVVLDCDAQSSSDEAVALTARYSCFTTGDYDSDGSREIMLLTLSSADSKPEATLIDYDKNQLYIQSSCSLNPGVTRLEQVQSSAIREGVEAVVVDEMLSDSYNTQVIAFNDSRLQIEVCAETPERTQPLKSCDIDGDGFTEIPEISSSPTPKRADAASAAPMIIWHGCPQQDSSGEFSADAYCFCSFEHGYCFMLMQELEQSATAVISADNKSMSIYRLENNKRGGLIITFRVFDSGDSAEKGSGFTVLDSYGGLDYCYNIFDSELIGEDAVKENFMLFNKTDVQ